MRKFYPTIKKYDRTYNWKFCEHFLTSGNSTKAQLGCRVSILSHLFCICLTSPQSCTSLILFIIVISYVLSLNISSTLECRETHESKANQAIAASTWKKMREKNEKKKIRCVASCLNHRMFINVVWCIRLFIAWTRKHDEKQQKHVANVIFFLLGVLSI